MHIGWCERFFASDEEHFDRVREAIFGRNGCKIYPEAAARLHQHEQNYARRIMSLYAGLGLLNGI